MKVRVREAKEKDAEQLTEIAIASKCYWNYPDSWFELWGHLLEISPEFIRENNVWVATDNTKMYGFIAISVNDHTAELEHMWVLPEFIKKNVGKTLFECAVSYCKSNAIHTLRIESDPNAKAFYEKMGAQHVGFVDSTPIPRKLPVLELTFES